MSVVFVAAMFMSIMDVTIVNVALPTIGRDFSVSPTAVDSISIALPGQPRGVHPRLGLAGRPLRRQAGAAHRDRGLHRSPRRCAAWRPAWASWSRSGSCRARAAACSPRSGWPCCSGPSRPRSGSGPRPSSPCPPRFAPALGPVLGGLLVTELSWRWVFYVNVPIGVGGPRVRRRCSCARSPRASRAASTCPGSCCRASASGCSCTASRKDRTWAGARPSCSPPSPPALVLLAAMVLVELRTAEPIVALRLLGNRLFRSANGVMILASIAFLGTLFVISLYYQDGRGLSRAAVRAEHVPRGHRRHARRPAGQPGALPAARARAGTSPSGWPASPPPSACWPCWPPSTSLWWARLLMFALGLAMAQVFVPTQAAAFATISPAATGRASTHVQRAAPARRRHRRRPAHHGHRAGRGDPPRGRARGGQSRRLPDHLPGGRRDLPRRAGVAPCRSATPTRPRRSPPAAARGRSFPAPARSRPRPPRATPPEPSCHAAGSGAHRCFRRKPRPSGRGGSAGAARSAAVFCRSGLASCSCEDGVPVPGVSR